MFKILCLDGGGARGYFTSYILKRIEDEFSIKLNEYFDLIIGTSTGAIIAGALAVNVPIDDVLNVYKYDNDKIFDKNKFNIGMFYSIYSNENLKKILLDKLKGKDFKDVITNVIITTTDIETKTPVLVKSYDNKGFSLIDAMLSSSAAPIYFDPYKHENRLYSDGSLWCNNPSIIGISEALSKDVFNKKLEEIKILSIGTGVDRLKNDYSKQTSFGLVTFAKDLVNIMISSNSKSSNNVSNAILNDRYLRIDYDIYERKSIDKLPKSLINSSEQIFLENYDRIKEFLDIELKEKKYNFVQRVVKKLFKI